MNMNMNQELYIYTSYFANLRYIPKNFIPISTSLYSPNWYRGLEYKKLAPNRKILLDYKLLCDVKKYIHDFNSQILTRLDVDEVVRELVLISGNSDERPKNDIVLLCYEKPGDFCHRHLVADWFNENGYTSVEIEKGIHW